MRMQCSVASSVLLLILTNSLYSQTAPTLNEANTTFHTNVRNVLVDVTVINNKGNPVANLQKNDFEVFEEGKLQKIASFEEHKGAPPNQVVSSPLPPSYYTNYPSVKSADSVNVLVLDTLNTPLEFQLNVHRNVVNYLNEMIPGPRIAIFTLNKKMRMVQGFTTDHSVLLDALNHKDWGGGPQTSPLLDNAGIATVNPQADLDSKMLGMMASGHATSGSVQLMTDVLSMRNDLQLQSRTQITIQALQQLAQYLSGFPGRKNVIWFSSSFPVGIVPIKGPHLADFSYADTYSKQVQKTTNLLTAAQVAIYPIAAEGLELNRYTNASGSQSPGMGASFGRTLAVEGESRNSKILAMQEIAEDTGGKAFYNNNGLKEEIGEAINDGSHYYTISYTPTDKRTDGKFRSIKVKFANSEYKLAYRRGYYAGNGKNNNKVQPQPRDPLQPLMQRGMPSSSQIVYKVRVLSYGQQQKTETSIAGDNTKLKRAVTRYAVDFAVSTQDLELKEMSDGMRHANLEVTLVAYDHDGNPLNWLVRDKNMSLTPQLYAVFERGGLQLHEEIDVPRGNVFLRTGVYDFATQKAGTLEIPLLEEMASTQTSQPSSN
jgi:VWFA-related protein